MSTYVRVSLIRGGMVKNIVSNNDVFFPQPLSYFNLTVASEQDAKMEESSSHFTLNIIGEVSFSSFLSSQTQTNFIEELSFSLFVESFFTLHYIDELEKQALPLNEYSNFQLMFFPDVFFPQARTKQLIPLESPFSYVEPRFDIVGTVFNGLDVNSNRHLVLGKEPQQEKFEDSEDDSFMFSKISGDWLREYWDNTRGFVYRSDNTKDGEKSELNFKIIHIPHHAVDKIISFDYFVSTEKEKDKLSMMIDSEPIVFSGNLGWNTISKSVGRGENFVELRYSKSDRDNLYLDRICIDNIKLKYRELNDEGSRISQPISLNAINYYIGSKIEWEKTASDEYFNDNVFFKLYISLDNGLSWIEVLNNGGAIPGFQNRKDYENKNLLIKQEMKRYLDVTPVLKKLKITIDGFTLNI